MAVTQAESDEPQVSATVLAVEDEQAVRELTVRILQRLGYSVLSAASGREAIEVSNSFVGRISFLIADVVMPEMSGRQVADALLATRPEIRVLFLSGYTEPTAISQGVGTGVNFLPKPFSRESLAKKLLEITNNAHGVGA